MSVLVKGMEMPKNCCCCKLADSKIDSAPREGSWSVIRNCKGKVVWDGYYETGDAVCQKRRPDDCPLVEVPTPHGRLIEDTPTIIPADNEAAMEVTQNG